MLFSGSFISTTLSARSGVSAVLQRVKALQPHEVDKIARDVMQSLIEGWAASWIEHLRAMISSTWLSSVAIAKFDELRRVHLVDTLVMLRWAIRSAYESRRFEDARRLLQLSVDLITTSTGVVQHPISVRFGGNASFRGLKKPSVYP
jgi:VIT1/CCC1 family predicted Fe2+/Mn2+ transporter